MGYELDGRASCIFRWHSLYSGPPGCIGRDREPFFSRIQVATAPINMLSTDFIQPQAIESNLKGTTREEILRELSNLLVASYPELAMLDVGRLLQAREELSSTAMDGGLAIPHAKVPRLERMMGAFGRSLAGVHFGAPDGGRTHLFFVLISPERNAGGHLMALAHISRIFKDEDRRKALLEAGTSEVIYQLL